MLQIGEMAITGEGLGVRGWGFHSKAALQTNHMVRTCVSRSCMMGALQLSRISSSWEANSLMQR